MPVDVQQLRESVEALVEAHQPPTGDATRLKLGQVFTPTWLATRLAAMVVPAKPAGDNLRLVDLGAGMGALSAEVVLQLVELGWRGTLALDAVELDPLLAERLGMMLSDVAAQVKPAGIDLAWQVHHADAIEWAAERIDAGELADLVVINPPYGKLHADSETRALLLARGIRVTDSYAAFMAMAADLARPDGGRAASLTPRSFTNGLYFRDLRRHLWARLTIQSVWVCAARNAFAGKDVLQETMILVGERGAERPQHVMIAVGEDEAFSAPSAVVTDGSAEGWLRLPTDPAQAKVLQTHDARPETLESLGISSSAGPIVTYRSDEQLQREWREGYVAFVEARHLTGGRLTWPSTTRPNALSEAPMGGRWDFPQGNYVLVRRMTSKEEKRRVQATLYLAGETPGDRVTFGLGLNVLHADGAGMDEELGRGLVAWLNGQEADQVVRTWNGSINVNANDLRALRFPSREELLALGRA